MTDPDALFAALKPFPPRLPHVGHEANAMPPWLDPELTKLHLSAVSSWRSFPLTHGRPWKI